MDSPVDWRTMPLGCGRKMCQARTRREEMVISSQTRGTAVSFRLSMDVGETVEEPEKGQRVGVALWHMLRRRLDCAKVVD
jgi:hypothetical protein